MYLMQTYLEAKRFYYLLSLYKHKIIGFLCLYFYLKIHWLQMLHFLLKWSSLTKFDEEDASLRSTFEYVVRGTNSLLWAEINDKRISHSLICTYYFFNYDFTFKPSTNMTNE